MAIERRIEIGEIGRLEATGFVGRFKTYCASHSKLVFRKPTHSEFSFHYHFVESFMDLGCRDMVSKRRRMRSRRGETGKGRVLSPNWITREQMLSDQGTHLLNGAHFLRLRGGEKGADVQRKRISAVLVIAEPESWVLVVSTSTNM